jgi:hypothetical protein
LFSATNPRQTLTATQKEAEAALNAVLKLKKLPESFPHRSKPNSCAKVISYGDLSEFVKVDVGSRSWGTNKTDKFCTDQLRMINNKGKTYDILPNKFTVQRTKILVRNGDNIEVSLSLSLSVAP